VAKFCAERMHEVIAEEWDRETVDGYEWHRRWESAFSSGFERADNESVTEAAAPEMVGSTAVVVVLSGCQIITSNCGDSRAILCRGTQTIPLTVDQKVKFKTLESFTFFIELKQSAIFTFLLLAICLSTLF
jgi:protein phosphatase 2C